MGVVWSCKRRDETTGSDQESLPHHGKPFTGLLFCGACGAPFNRKKTPVRVFWRCARNLGMRDGKCDMKGIPEQVLEDMLCELFGNKWPEPWEHHSQDKRNDDYTAKWDRLFLWRTGQRSREHGRIAPARNLGQKKCVRRSLNKTGSEQGMNKKITVIPARKRAQDSLVSDLKTRKRKVAAYARVFNGYGRTT